MGLSEEAEDNTLRRYEELCLDLNLDKSAKEEAWECFERISTNYTLEGDGIHWLACSLYVACRKSVPTVGRGETEGNCVSLTRLLRSVKLSLIHFFNKMKKWSDMANLPQDFRDKVDRLERNFAVSTVIFKKFQPIFLDIFRNPAVDPPKVPRSRKQRRLPCTPSEVFSFCWTMFVQVKGNFPAISDDLVNSYHLLLCCIDWFYGNGLLSNRKDLLNPTFSGLPVGFEVRDYKPPTEVPCLIQQLCDQHEGLVVEALGIKEYWWKPHIKRLFDKKILKGKVDNLTGILDIGTFENNSKSINQAYEMYVLSVGDFDERIFLGDDSSTEIGTPAKSTISTGDLAERMQVKKIHQSFELTRSLAPSTPLTGRRYLKEKEAPITPVSTATQSVSRLQSLLSGRKTLPSDTLLDIFSQCIKNPKEEIISRVKQMGECFCTQYNAQQSDESAGSHIDFAKKRLQLGESLYYKALENIMLTEKKRIEKSKDKSIQSKVFSTLLDQDLFHRSLFACCLEIVIFSYNSLRTFPWIVEIFDISPYHFYKVIEVLIRAEDGLSRDVVKHLNHIEETILESLAWKADSPLWEAISATDAGVPMCEEVTLPSQFEKEGVAAMLISPPPIHPAVKRIAGEGQPGIFPKKDLLQSPVGPSAADRFSSPSPGSAKRRLFAGGPSTGSTISVSTSASSDGTDGQTSHSQNIITFQQAQMEDGRQVLIPVQIPVQMSASTSTASSVSVSTSAATGTTLSALAPPQAVSASTSVSGSTSASANKPRRTGSLALFFRKVYHLASVRLRDLCERLGVENDLRAQMWTIYEHTLVHHIELMCERHLDQLIMCSIYVMAKVTGQDRPFQEIMRNYRLQPQAASHVYRSVLLLNRRRHQSGSSDSSRNGASGSSSPVTTKDEEPKEGKDTKDKKRTEKLSTIRSSSTLPVPHPSSQPPTPTRLAGTGSSFEFEDRGDLIKFYNVVYVKKIKSYALRFSTKQGDEAPPLSPLPMVRSHPTSPRRVSSTRSVFISPHKVHPPPLTPQSRMLYCFNRSPAKDLRAINKMLELDERRSITAGKRLLRDDNQNEAHPRKIRCVEHSGNPLINRISEVLSDRQEACGSR